MKPAARTGPTPTPSTIDGMRLAGLLALCLALAVPAFPSPPTPGWTRFDLTASSSYAELFVPPTLDRSVPAPLVVFLHGAGATPYPYEPFLAGAANTLGAVLVLPKSQTPEGWGTAGDRAAVREAVRHVGSLLSIDPARIALAGHSAGGAFALQIAIGDRGWCAAFALASPAIAIGRRGDPLYLPPVRLYYGADDPNWFGGAGQRLIDALHARGVSVQLDLRHGYGHNTWPDESMLAGLQFLIEHPRPVAVTAPRVAAN